MGCGVSKEGNQIVATTIPKPKLAESVTDSSQGSDVLSKRVIPSIPINTVGQSVAFEIPLDELTESIKPAKTLSQSAKLSLPKLTISENDIKAKLANTEARWKVGNDLDNLLYGDLADQQETKKRRRGDKPKLKSRKEKDPEDLAALKLRLLEKEQAAKINRDREISKLQLKLARQEEHARKVLERKKALGAGSNEELRLSWGGEKGLGDSVMPLGSQASLNTESNQDVKLGNLSAVNRMGSGRSNATDTTDTTDVVGDRPSTVDPLKTVFDISINQTAPTS
ncbi:hypothetical protein HK103_005380 [Boothiomyces macroporosus]|uniref:Uncharacterized protein n=1 Tax=Boothiomyces macroporosus TaxID=261099 RepID=A0AAD5UNQ0_9FUNG|nr:hypothetical protein HK103_005380 [Boothiomyces macroporosus]